MALADHLRELRARVMRVGLVLVVAIVVALFFYDQLSEILHPYRDAPAILEAKGVDRAGDHRRRGPLLLQLKLCAGRRRGDLPVLALPDLGLHRARACTPTRGAPPSSSRSSPVRCSSPVSRWATTCSPRAWRC